MPYETYSGPNKCNSVNCQTLRQRPDFNWFFGNKIISFESMAICELFCIRQGNGVKLILIAQIKLDFRRKIATKRGKGDENQNHDSIMNYIEN